MNTNVLITNPIVKFRIWQTHDITVSTIRSVCLGILSETCLQQCRCWGKHSRTLWNIATSQIVILRSASKPVLYVEIASLGWTHVDVFQCMVCRFLIATVNNEVLNGCSNVSSMLKVFHTSKLGMPWESKHAITIAISWYFIYIQNMQKHIQDVYKRYKMYTINQAAARRWQPDGSPSAW